MQQVLQNRIRGTLAPHSSGTVPDSSLPIPCSLKITITCHLVDFHQLKTKAPRRQRRCRYVFSRIVRRLTSAEWGFCTSGTVPVLVLSAWCSVLSANWLRGLSPVEMGSTGGNDQAASDPCSERQTGTDPLCVQTSLLHP